jgi:ABC-type nitrate/sulfonate/bicarbonate transport system substrate-binding protein
LMPYDATLLLKGEYDVVQGYSVDEAVELEMTGHSLNLIFLHDHGYAAYGQVYFTSEDFLKRDPATVRKFMEVSRRGWQNAAASPDEAAEIVVRHFLKGADVTHQRASLKAIIPLLTREGGPESYGRMSRETWQAAVAAYNALPSAPRKLSVEEFVVFNLQAP